MFVSLSDSTLLLGILVFITLALWGLGRLGQISASPTEDPTLLWQGWGLFAGTLTVLGTLTSVPMLSAAYGLLTIGFLVWGWQWRPSSGWWLVVALLPFLWAGLWAQPALWDDFAHRLGSVQYLAVYQQFPGEGRPAALSGFPAYPYGLSFIGAAASWLMGFYQETALAVFGGVHLVAFALLVVGTLRRVTGGVGGWVGLTVTALFTTLLNPLLDMKLLYSGYDDVAVAMTLAALLVAVVALWDKLQQRQNPWREALACAWIGVLLILLKQTGIVLLAGLGLGVLLLALIRGALGQVRLWLAGALVFILPLAVWACWRWYVGQALPAGESMMQAAATWHTAQIPQIVMGMGQQFIEKPHLFLPQLSVLVLAVMLGWRQQLFTGRGVFIWLGSVLVVWQVLFLLGAYVVAFSEYEALRAASFERYMMHVGWACWLAVLLYLIPVLTAWLRRRIWGRTVAVAGLIALVMVPLIAGPAMVPHETASARQVRLLLAGAALPDGAKLMVYDPQGDGYAAKVARYILAQPGVEILPVSRFRPVGERGLAGYVADTGVTHVLLLAVDEPWRQAFPAWLEPGFYAMPQP